LKVESETRDGAHEADAARMSHRVAPKARPKVNSATSGANLAESTRISLTRAGYRLALLATAVRAAMGDILAAAVLIELIKMTTVFTGSAGRCARL